MHGWISEDPPYPLLREGGPLARERFFFSLERKKNLSQKNSEKDLNLSQTFFERLSNLSLARERFYPHS